MTINAVTYKGRTYTRTGKAYSHVVVTTSKASDRPLVEWASTLDLADKNRQAHINRADRVAKDGVLSGVYSTDYYRQFIDSVVVEVEHPAAEPTSTDQAAGRATNRAADGEDAPVEPVAPVKPAKTVKAAAPVATNADADAKRRERWAANKRASRARLAAKAAKGKGSKAKAVHAA